uniref:TonB-dependent receptor n=1 Tax=uncultured Draconibacterium sp. TaxID=1573823 RepID=UPI003217BDD4
MRITVFILLCTGFNLLAKGTYSQSDRISVKFEETTLKDVLKEIEEASGYFFLYNNELIDVQRAVSIDVEGSNVTDILNLLFDKTDVSYTILDRQIVLTIKPSDLGSTKKDQPQKKELIRGKVLDSGGVPLPGATIQIKGTTLGTVTDPAGYYTIAADEGQVLLFSFSGFKPQEITVGKKTAIDVILQEDITTLEEAVVVGMGKQRRASVIGSISTISVNDLKIPSRSLTNALSGRMAGAVVVQRSGEPGNDNASFWIRGISTFGSNRSPLILVDGVERNMNDLSVEEIESISILKDASATAVYGVRAANGVVLVTTRKGVAQTTSVEVKMEYGVSDLPRMPKFLDGPNYAKLYNEALGYDNYSSEYIENTAKGVDPYLYPNVNWFDETFKDYSNNKQTSINIRGGGEVARYFVSFGYLDEEGNFKSNPENDYDSNIDLKRYNFRSNIDVTLSKSLIMDIEVGGHLTDLHTPGIGQGYIYSTYYSPAEELFYHSYWATPISNPVKVPIGTDASGNDIMGWGAPSQIGESNPAERLMGSGYNTSFQNQIMSQLSVTQDLNKLIDGLQLKLSYSFDAYSETYIKRRKNSTTYAVEGRDPETNQILVKEIQEGQDFLNYSRSVNSNRAKEFKGQLIYDRVFNTHHRVGGMFMYYQRDYINGNAASSILALPYRKQGIAFRATYSFKDRYLGEFNMGYNGSENFPQENRFGVFPAVALGWLASNEPFWDSMTDKINLLKVKGSMGLVGAEALPNGQRYGYLSLYGSGLGNYVFGENGTTYYGTGENRIGVTNLTWEKGLKKNIGIELRMFDNAISLEADYFHEKRTDILVQRATIPDYVGMISSPFANMGEMVNRGFDGTLEFTKRFTDGGIKLYGNYTYSRDKITEMDEAKKNYDYRMRTGQKLNQKFGLISLGYFESEEDIANSPVQTFGEYRPGDIKYKDINGDGQITIDDEVPIGYSNLPEIVYGFGVQVDYKGFDLGVFFRGQARVSYNLGGNYIPFSQGVGKGNLFEKALDRWTVDNPDQNAQYPRLYNGTSSNNWQVSTKTIYDGSFLRLADIEFGKSFGKDVLEKVKLKGLRVYVHVNNAAIFSKWKMWDPETGDNDGSKYPLQRKMNLGIRANF